MASQRNLSLIFKKVPNGMPRPGTDLVVEDRPIDLSKVPEGGYVLENLYASFDPYMRNLLTGPGEGGMGDYMPPFKLDGPLLSRSIARVAKSNHDDIKEGDLVVGFFSIQEYIPVTTDMHEKGGISKLQNPLGIEDPAEFLGALGMTGLTAYSSLYEIGQPKKGETIFISAASGAVGQIVGQLAKREGLRVVGSVGSQKKLDFITKELDFDAAFNYKEERPLEALKRICPDGIDIYYENVGGEQLDAALACMKKNGRICVSGMISQYNLPVSERYGVKNLMMVITQSLTIRGFLVGSPEFGPKWSKKQQEYMGKWVKNGEIKTLLSFTEGMEKAAEGFVGMLKGDNFGKSVLRVRK